MGATQPLPDETPGLVPPSRVPPVATGTIPPLGGYGGGGGRHVTPRRFRIIALILSICGVAALALLIGLIPRRAPTFLVALAFVTVGFVRRRHGLWSRSHWLEFSKGEIYLWSIAGGVIGELVAQLVFHIDPGAPLTPLWLLLGAAGIGGACGIGVGALASMTVTGVVSGWTIWRNNWSAA